MAFFWGDIPGIHFGIDYGHYGLCTFVALCCSIEESLQNCVLLFFLFSGLLFHT